MSDMADIVFYLKKDDDYMIGIYKITNKNNGKIYIGQSNDCERRLKEHCYPSRCNVKSPLNIDQAIQDEGKENFIFEILEECNLQNLNEKESYWIAYYQSNSEKGYNNNSGGSQASIGEENGNAKITEEDVKLIRIAYKNRQNKHETYKLVKDKITYSSFEKVWQGGCWGHIMPEAFTEENKQYYSIGENCISNQTYSDDEIMQFRYRYVKESAKDIYNSLENPKITFQSFQKMLNGTTNNHLPYYSKKRGQWFEAGEKPRPLSDKRGKHPTSGTFTDEEVLKFRHMYVNLTARQIYEQENIEGIVSFDTFTKILRGAHYKHLPYYSKNQNKWINL